MKREYIGRGSLGRCLAHLLESGIRKPFAIASQSSLDRQRHMLGWLSDALTPDSTFSDFSPNPSFDDILRARAKCRAFNPDFLIALGGGSAIDVAKGVKCATGPFESEPDATVVPFAALPTTAGSGSEATHFAAYYRGGEKHSLAHPDLLPDVAVVDPELSASMPPGLAAATGFDALAQAVESIWAINATDASRNFALQALHLLLPNIENAVAGTGTESGTAMAVGANLAGKAINISKTTAPHALSYYLTKRYNIAHGHAAALMMPYFFVINAGQPGSRFVQDHEPEPSSGMLKIMLALECPSPAACAAKWMDLMHACGLATTFEALKITGRDEIREIIANANAERLGNNPVRFSPEELEMLMMRGMSR